MSMVSVGGSSQGFPELPAPILRKLFHGKQWLEILDDKEESWAALDAVAKRVQELNEDFWCPLA